MYVSIYLCNITEEENERKETSRWCTYYIDTITFSNDLKRRKKEKKSSYTHDEVSRQKYIKHIHYIIKRDTTIIIKIYPTSFFFLQILNTRSPKILRDPFLRCYINCRRACTVPAHKVDISTINRSV